MREKPSVSHRSGAINAELLRLTKEQIAWTLADCDHAVEQFASNPFTGRLDTRSFWRVEKSNRPEHHYTVACPMAYRPTVAACPKTDWFGNPHQAALFGNVYEAGKRRR
jgi:hypothetical protein